MTTPLPVSPAASLPPVTAGRDDNPTPVSVPVVPPDSDAGRAIAQCHTRIAEIDADLDADRAAGRLSPLKHTNLHHERKVMREQAEALAAMHRARSLTP